MAFTRKSLMLWFWIALAALVIGILIYVFRCRIFKNLTSCVEDPNESNTPVPLGSPTPQWVPESFPLNIGMFGPKVKALQKKFGFPVASQDGKLGPQTAAAVQAAGKAFPLSESDYEALINPPATGGGTNFQLVKMGLGSSGQNFNGGIRGYMAGPNQVYRFDFYTNGRVFVYDAQGQEKRRGTYSDGGKYIVFDNNGSYSANTVTMNMRNIANDLG